MYRLTERRLKKVEPILEEYRTQLHDRGAIMFGVLERELKDGWGCGYRELKDIFKQLSKITRYRYLAAYYMEHSGHGSGVISEFQSTLAELYGIDNYHGPKRNSQREAFWRKLKKR